MKWKDAAIKKVLNEMNDQFVGIVYYIWSW